MKNTLINISISIIIWITTFINLAYLKDDYVIWQDDALRHSRFAYDINTYWFLKNDTHYNWWNVTTYSILNDYNVDLWQWHHLLLSFLLKLWINIENINSYYTVICIILLSFLILFINSELKNPAVIWLWVIWLLIFFNNDILSRILLSRPFLITIILFFLILIVLFKKKYYYLWIIFLMASFYHFLFFLLFIPIILYILIYELDKKVKIKILLLSLLWSIMWIFIHTKSLSYVILWFITIFWVPILQIKSQISVSELWNYSWVNLYILFSLFLIINLYLYIIIKNSANKITLFHDKFYVFITSQTLILFILSIFILRFWDFLLVSYAFSLVYSIKKILEIEWWKINNKINIYWSLWIIIFIYIFQSIFISIKNKDESNFIWDKKIFINNSAKYMPEWSMILWNNFYYFYYFYYYLWNHYKYLMSMEQMYIYMYDKKIFLDLQDILLDYRIQPKNKNIKLYDYLKKLWVNYYVILDDETNYIINRSLLYKIDLIKKDTNFKLIYKYKNNYLWQIK